MSCREQLLTLLSEELDELARVRALRHAQECAACRDLVPLFELSAQDLTALSAEDGSASDPDIPLDPAWHDGLFARTSGSPCEQAELAIVGASDQAPPAELVERHLSNCAPCREFAHTQRALDQLLPTMAAVRPPETVLKRVLFRTHGAAVQTPAITQPMSAPQRLFETLLSRPRIAVEASYAAAVLIWLLFSIPFSSNAWLKDAYAWIDQRSQASWSFVSEDDSPIAQLTRNSLDAGKEGFTDFSQKIEERVYATQPTRQDISVASKSLREAAAEFDLRQGSSAVTELTRGIGRLPIQFLSKKGTALEPTDDPDREMPQGDSNE